jgi:hypothetical protein
LEGLTSPGFTHVVGNDLCKVLWVVMDISKITIYDSPISKSWWRS